MKSSITILLGGAMAMLVAIPQLAAFFGQKKSGGGELRERDEIKQSFRLAPGSRVEVSDIRGPVEVETTDTEVAEVHVVRSAPGRAELARYKVSVESGAQGLSIRGEQSPSRNGSMNDPDVRHHVRLKLPRRVDLSALRIGGDVKVGDLAGRLSVGTVTGALHAGEVGGQIEVTGVAGGVSIARAARHADIKTVTGPVNIGQASDSLNVNGVSGLSVGRADGRVEIKTVTGDLNIGQASDTLDVTGVSGLVSVGVSKLGAGGVQIRTVTGRVELRFSGELNAQLSTDTIVGELAIDLPNVTVQSRPNVSAVRAQIGKGGPPITLNSVSKGVRLVRGS